MTGTISGRMTAMASSESRISRGASARGPRRRGRGGRGAGGRVVVRGREGGHGSPSRDEALDDQSARPGIEVRVDRLEVHGSKMLPVDRQTRREDDSANTTRHGV